MDTERQRDLILSHLQSIDMMCAMILVIEPTVVFREHGSVDYSDLISWEVDQRVRQFHTVSLFRAVRASGLVAFRALINMLGISASQDRNGRVPKLQPKERRRVETTDDLKSLDFAWYDIPGARGLTLAMLTEFSRKGNHVIDEAGKSCALSEVLLSVLKVVDKSFAHITHEGDWSDTLYGNVVSAAVFSIIAAQELILARAWCDTYDGLVFSNSRLLLPDDLYDDHMRTIDEYRRAFVEVMRDVGSE